VYEKQKNYRSVHRLVDETKNRPFETVYF